MADLRYVQAAPGCRVLNPDTMKPIPVFGNADKASLQIDADRGFWFRRLRDLDVIEVTEAGDPVDPAAAAEAVALWSQAAPAPAASAPVAPPAPPAPPKADPKVAPAPSVAPAGVDQATIGNADRAPSVKE
jgi:hypothetical protein